MNHLPKHNGSKFDQSTDIDIKALIYTTLEVNHCKLEESNGIVTVTTPAGTTWDFTVPTEVVQSPKKK